MLLSLTDPANRCGLQNRIEVNVLSFAVRDVRLRKKTWQITRSYGAQIAHKPSNASLIITE